jgi:hypothetical protein
MTLTINIKHILDQAINIFNRDKYKDRLYGAHYNYTKYFSECFEEYTNSLNLIDFKEYLKDYDQFEQLCIFIISIKVFINSKKINYQDEYYLDILFLEKDNSEYNKQVTNNENSYVFLKSKELKKEIDICSKSMNEETIDISKIKVTEYKKSGFEELKNKKSKNAIEAFNKIPNNKIFKTIELSKFSPLLKFHVSQIKLYPFIFHHFSYLRRKENGSNRILNKINLIGEIVSSKLNKFITYNFKNKNSAYTTYRLYMKMFNNVKNNGNIYQLDVKSAYDNLNHELLLKMMPDIVKPFISAFLNSSINFRCMDRNIITLHRTKGIPIGSVLSPMLYELYIENILDNNIKIDNYVRFVDDFRIVYDKDFEELKIKFKNSGLLLNENKTKKLDLNDMFLKFPNNVKVFEAIFQCYPMLLKDVSERSKHTILLNKIFNYQKNTLNYFNDYAINHARLVYNEYITDNILTSCDNYINYYLKNIVITKYNNEEVMYKTGSTLDYMFQKNKTHYLELYYAPNKLYQKCNICFDFNMYNISCSNKCNICIDCFSNQIIYCKNLTCPNCNSVINTKLNKNIIYKVLKSKKFEYIKNIYTMKTSLTKIHESLTFLQNNDNIQDITAYIESEDTSKLLHNLSDYIINLLDEYKIQSKNLKEYIEKELLSNHRSILKLKCKYCLQENNTTNDKLFKCECKDLYQCKLCPAEFNVYTDHKCSDTTKLCPECRIPIERTSGCNHMKCINCDKEFDFNAPLFLITFDYRPLNQLRRNIAYNYLLIYERILYIILNFKIDSYESLLSNI